MSRSTTITQDVCEELRVQASNDRPTRELAKAFDVGVGTIRYHVHGECSHVTTASPLARPGSGLDGTRCHEIRTQFAAGDDPDTIADELGHSWKTVVTHLTGDCDHGDERVVERREVLYRLPVEAEDCARLRETYASDDAVDLLSLQREVPWSYQTVARHVNGHCAHDVEAAPRTPRKRATISRELCEELRERYRADTDLTLGKLGPLADEYDPSVGTIKRHVRYRCTHDPGPTLLDRVEGWERLVEEHPLADPGDPPEEPSGAELPLAECHPSVNAERANESGIEGPDPVEAVVDLAAPEPRRVETTTSRIVRNTALASRLKKEYEHQCQLCDDTRHRGPEDPYAEAHHIKPLGMPHDGPDTRANILVLCPNHHADFDHGLVYVDPETFEVTHATDNSVSGVTLTIRDGHDLAPETIAYHNEKVAKL